MNFWHLNKRMVITLSAFPVVGCLFVIYSGLDNLDEWTFLFAMAVILLGYAFLFLLFFLPAINSFLVIRRLTGDNGAYSILPLFDAGYSVELRNEKSWFMFTTPCISATISELPVVIFFEPGSKYNPARIEFSFSPLMKEGSKRIYSNSISFKLPFVKRLLEDIKPDVLKCVEKTKESGLKSGAGRPISTVHFEAYE